MMVDLPTAKAGLESDIVKKKTSRPPIDVLAKIPSYVLQPPVSKTDPNMGQPGDTAVQGQPVPSDVAATQAAPNSGVGEPGPAPDKKPSETTLPQKTRRDTTANLSRYEESQEKAARKGMDKAQQRDAEDERNNSEPTSFWVPMDVKEGLLGLNARTFKRRVKINLRSLVLYAYDQLKVMPDERLADVMEPYTVKRKRKKDGED